MRDDTIFYENYVTFNHDHRISIERTIFGEQSWYFFTFEKLSNDVICICTVLATYQKKVRPKKNQTALQNRLFYLPNVPFTLKNSFFYLA